MRYLSVCSGIEAASVAWAQLGWTAAGYSEAKAVGYDVKILRQIVRLRAIPADERREQQAILDVMMSALGMV